MCFFPIQASSTKLQTNVSDSDSDSEKEKDFSAEYVCVLQDILFMSQHVLWVKILLHKSLILKIYLFFFLSLYSYIIFSLYLFVCLFVCLFICLSGAQKINCLVLVVAEQLTSRSTFHSCHFFSCPVLVLVLSFFFLFFLSS